MNFVNAAEDTVLFQSSVVHIEWEEIGQLNYTDCRLDQADQTGEFSIRGTFIRCKNEFGLCPVLEGPS